MMRATKLVVACVVVVVATVGQVQASPITEPTSLSPGDQYRLAFVTSTLRDAVSGDISVYNSFVDLLGDTVIASDWRVIGSTSIDARTNTDTDPRPPGPTGVPIFLLNDTLLASNYDDLWDGSRLQPLNIDESGGVITSARFVWTGTHFDGIFR